MIGLLSYKLKKRFWLLYFGAQIVLGTLVYHAPMHSGSSNIYQNGYLFNIIAILTICVLLGSAVGKRVILTTIISYAIVCLIDMISSGGVALLLNVDKDNAFQNFIFNLLPNLFTIFILFIIYLLKRKINTNIAKSYFNIHSKYIILIIFGIIGIGLYIAPIQIFGLLEHRTKLKTLVALSVSISGILFIVISVGLVIMNDSKNHYKDLLEMNNKLIEQQKAYYQTLIEKEQYTKRFRHDINNHIICLEHLCEQEKYKELSDYIHDMQKYMDSLKIRIQTGNEIVNIIVNDLYNKNMENNIKIKWRGVLPQNTKISSMDLCTIFSNLFTNAMEAVKKLDENTEKMIDVQIKYHQENIVIQVKNPVTEKVKVMNKRLITTKDNKDQHGFGSMNVESCVKKYQGSLQYYNLDNEFMVELIFCNIILE